MNRSQLEHILRASGAISLDDEFVVIGSQAILGAHPSAPEALRRSMELDLYPRNRPTESAAIDGAIGEGSLFHQTFGYFAHGVGPETATLPADWERRLIAVRNPNTMGVTGWCLHPVDLAVSKLVAGREHDLEFVTQMLSAGFVTATQVREALQQTDIGLDRNPLASDRLARLIRST